MQTRYTGTLSLVFGILGTLLSTMLVEPSDAIAFRAPRAMSAAPVRDKIEISKGMGQSPTWRQIILGKIGIQAATQDLAEFKDEIGQVILIVSYLIPPGQTYAGSYQFQCWSLGAAVGRPNRRVGWCQYPNGLNFGQVFHNGDSNHNGIPDCFLMTHWENEEPDGQISQPDGLTHQDTYEYDILNDTLKVVKNHKSTPSFLSMTTLTGSEIPAPDDVLNPQPLVAVTNGVGSHHFLADVNRDGVVDDLDRQFFAAAFGAVVTDANYVSWCDVVHLGVIDQEDADIINISLLQDPINDHTAPVVTSISASPNVIPTADLSLVPVTIAVTAVDDVDPSPVNRIIDVRSNAPELDAGDIVPIDDWNINLRARQAAGGAARVYTITVSSEDGNANISFATVTVTVAAAPPDTIPPIITNVTATPNVIAPADLRMVPVTVGVTATDNQDPFPTSHIVGVSSDDPGDDATDIVILGDLSVSLRARGGTAGAPRTYTIRVVSTDAAGNTSAESSVAVTVLADATPPVILSASATPSVLTPPDLRMVPVSIAVDATDTRDPNPTNRIFRVDSNAPSFDAADIEVTGNLTLNLRARPASPTVARDYRICLTSTDAQGNRSAIFFLHLLVPAADITPPVITSITASPSVLTPHNKKLVPVTISVTATDDRDPAPTSKIISVTSNEPLEGPHTGKAPDFEITGDLTVSLRAEVLSKEKDGERIYTVTVETKDAAGNASRGTVTVSVPR